MFPRTAHVVVYVVALRLIYTYRRRRADLWNSVAAVWQAVLHLILENSQFHATSTYF